MTATAATVTINRIQVLNSSAITTDEPGESAEWELTFMVNGISHRWYHEEVKDQTSYALNKVFPDVPLGANQTITISVSGVEHDSTSANDALPSLEHTFHPAQDFEQGGTRWLSSEVTQEGSYRIEVTIMPARMGGQMLTARSLYHAVYRRGRGRSGVWLGSWSSFQQKWREYSESGLRLQRVSVHSVDTGEPTFGDSSEPKFFGVFGAGNDGHALFVGDWSAFEANWRSASESGLRLVDVATYRHNGKDIFVGVFRAGTTGHAMIATGRAAFFQQWEAYSTAGLRLVAVDTFGTGPHRKFIGAFLAGNDAHAFVPDVDWAAFNTKWRALSESGLRLVDLNTYTEGNKVLYNGVFRAGGDSHLLTPPITWSDFHQDWRARAEQGLRLVSVERLGG